VNSFLLVAVWSVRVFAFVAFSCEVFVSDAFAGLNLGGVGPCVPRRSRDAGPYFLAAVDNWSPSLVTFSFLGDHRKGRPRSAAPSRSPTVAGELIRFCF